MKTIHLLLLHITCINVAVVISTIAIKLEDVFLFPINTPVGLLLLKFAPVVCAMVRACVCVSACVRAYTCAPVSHSFSLVRTRPIVLLKSLFSLLPHHQFRCLYWFNSTKQNFAVIYIELFVQPRIELGWANIMSNRVRRYAYSCN